jgi:uncharacterized membrane protein
MNDELVSLTDLDHSSRAGVLLAAVALGRSYQPNLLTRNTMDQAIVTGISAAAGYGLGVSGQSLLASVARRIAGGENDTGTLLAVNASALGTGLAMVQRLKWEEHEPDQRAVARLIAGAVAASSAAGLASMATGRIFGGRYRPLPLLTATAVAGVASWLAGKPRDQRPGSEIAPGVFFEDSAKQVKPPAAIAIGTVVTAVTLVLAKGESLLSRGMSRAVTFAVGGSPQEHRTAGRIAATAATYALGASALSAVTAKLQSGGEGMEPAHSTPPQQPEITGSPESKIPWAVLSREGRRWLSMALTPEGINAVMQRSDAVQPIRVYAALQQVGDPHERAQALLAEIDRTDALSRPVFALFSPTGSGYVNYVACETLEYLTGGNCASAAIQYSVLPSSLSLTKVSTGVQQTRMVLDGINDRLRAMPADKRPKVLLFGESLGSQVSEEVFRGTGTFGPRGAGIDSAIWIGTPAATEWRKELWGTRTITEPPSLGPEDYYLPRAIADWDALPEQERNEITYLLLQNGDDPIPKFDTTLLWRRPDWLTSEARPPGSPHGVTWTPVTTFFMTFLDMLNALTPTPGVFAEGGHDYRKVLPETISAIWNLPVTDEQALRMNWALRVRERAWELKRRWDAAQTAEDPDKARQKVLDLLSTWLGTTATSNDVESVLASGLQPTPAPGELPKVGQVPAFIGIQPQG